LGADNALSGHQFEAAARLFRELLKLSHMQGETWFDSGAYFLLAYTLMEMGQYDEALENLDRAIVIEPDVSMPVPDFCGMLTPNSLRTEILKRKSESG
jgi:tetratricopeptide (TPR) repeat protein